MYCFNCGAPNLDEAKFCKSCGLAQQVTPTPSGGTSAAQLAPAQGISTSDPRLRGAQVVAAQSMQPSGTYATGKRAALAVFLAFLIPGVGQLYAGDLKMGLIMLGVFLVCCLLMGVIIGFFGAAGIWIWSMIDAHKLASGKRPIS